MSHFHWMVEYKRRTHSACLASVVVDSRNTFISGIAAHIYAFDISARRC